MPTKKRIIVDLNLDADQRNANWIKSMRWDIRVGTKLVETYGELVRALGSERAIKHFMTTSAAKAMPDSLRAELEDHGYTLPEQE